MAFSTATTQLGTTLRGKRERLDVLYKTKGADGKSALTDAQREELKALATEVPVLASEFEQARGHELAEERNRDALKAMTEIAVPGGILSGGDGLATDLEGNVKSIGDLFVASENYQAYHANRRRGITPKFEAELAANLKALFVRSNGMAPFVTRQPGVIYSAQQEPKLIDLIPPGTITEAGMKFMLETVFTPGAAPTAEAAAAPESAFKVEEQYVDAKKIACFLPTSEEQLADVSGCKDYLDNRMLLGLKQAIDRQVATGDGTGENLKGLMGGAWTGMQAQAQGTDTVHDAIYKLMVKIMANGFTDATGIWLNPYDMQVIRLFKTQQGNYLFGNPDMVGTTRIWGVQAATSTYVPQGKILVGDFQQFSEAKFRSGIVTETSNSHADYFTSFKLAIRGMVRLLLVCYRPSAFGILTLNPGGVPATS